MAAALAAGLVAATAGSADAQTGPQDEGAVQTTGPLGVDAPEGEAPPDGAQKARRSEADDSGRPADHGARPAVLADRSAREAPVGTVGNGYVYSTFDQPTPIEGTFHGHARPGEAHRPAGNAAPG